MSMFILSGMKEGEKMEREFFPAQNCNFDIIEDKGETVRVRWTNQTGEISRAALQDPILLKYVWDGNCYKCTGKVFPVKKKATDSIPTEDVTTPEKLE